MQKQRQEARPVRPLVVAAFVTAALVAEAWIVVLVPAIVVVYCYDDVGLKKERQRRRNACDGDVIDWLVVHARMVVVV